MRQRLSRFFYNLKLSLARFMSGRNGNDQFNLFLLGCELALIILASIIKGLVGAVLYLGALGLLVYIYFRMCSKNVYRRQDENVRFLRAAGAFRTRLRLEREKWKQRRDYKFFTCPSCRTSLRVPKGRGKIKIVCRKCGTSFIGKS